MWIRDCKGLSQTQGLRLTYTEKGEPVYRQNSSAREINQLRRRVFEVDPLVCERCGGKFKVIGFITQPRVIRKILDHLKKRKGRNRAPPSAQSVSISL